jgi:hypothetical protein
MHATALARRVPSLEAEIRVRGVRQRLLSLPFSSLSNRLALRLLSALLLRCCSGGEIGFGQRLVAFYAYGQTSRPSPLLA